MSFPAIIGWLVILLFACGFLWGIFAILYRALRDTWIDLLNARDAGLRWSEHWRVALSLVNNLYHQIRAEWHGYTTCSIRKRPSA